MPVRPKRMGADALKVFKQHLARETAAQRGYDSRWQKARDGYLRSHPLCVHCERAGRVVAANEVDHIVPHKGDMVLFWDNSNWQSLCKSCHSLKTATEDGGFGRKVCYKPIITNED